MAASGGSLEWSSTLKPILTALYGPFFEKNDAVEIIQAILKSESEFQSHDASLDLFYTCFASLSAHFISAYSENLPVEHLSNARDACRIVLRQLLRKISEAAGTQCEENTNAATHVSIKQLLLPMVGLCSLDGGGLTQADQVILSSLLKGATLPSHFSVIESGKQTGQSSPIGSVLSASVLDRHSVASAGSYSASATQRRAECLMEQLTAPLKDSGAALPRHNLEDSSGTSGTTVDVKKWLADSCVSLLIELRAGPTLLKMCASLPCLQRYIGRLHTAKEAGAPPTFNADGTLLHFLVQEGQISQLALSLPCLEPLTPDGISTLSDISAAWLLCATTQASVHQKDEEGEQQSSSLVEGALCLFDVVGDTLKNSTRAGGYVYQNHLMIGGWVLLSGLHHALAGAPCPSSQGQAQGKSPAKTPMRPYNLNRMQQGVHVMWVALGARCTSIVGALLADARMEAGGGAAVTPDPSAEAALDVLAHHMAQQRAARLAQCAPLHQLLVVLAVVCYRKATNLKRAVVQKQHHDTEADQSDSTVYYQDMILCSEDSETDDEDSEPLLGLWFESTLVAPEMNEGSSSTRPSGGNEEADNAGTRQSVQNTIVPDKAEPYSYISLATEVLQVLCSEMVSCQPTWLGTPAIVLQDSQMALLAVLVRDLDRETSRTDTGTISACFGARLGSLYGAFSAALVRYLHNLMGSESFSSLHAVLLQNLGVGTLPGDWAALFPLQLGCRAVKLVGGSVLAKPTTERESCVLVVWHRAVHTLVECASQSAPSQDHDYEDLNVEHAQMLVYMFHSLNLMQKKSILLMTSNAIIRLTDSLLMSDCRKAGALAPHQYMLATRLMLLLEYLMRHLYDAPQSLLQQIEWNLVIAPGLAQSTSDSPTSANGSKIGDTVSKSRIYCSVPHVEQAYRKLSQDESSIRPKFYALTNSDINNQEMPKFDGLACNFALGTPHKLKYPLLLDALLSLLNASAVCDMQPNSSPLALCTAHYCFQTAWRLVISMPPSTPHMDRLQLGTGAVLSSALCLHAAVWAPRADNKKVFNPWLKDALVKQGMYTQYAENLLSGVSTACDNIQYTAWLASETIQHLKDNITDGMPHLLDVIACDATLARLRVCLSEAPPAAGHQDTQLVAQFIPRLLDLAETIFQCCRQSASLELEPLMSGGLEIPAAVWEARLRVCGSGAWIAPTGTAPPPSGTPQLGAWLLAQVPGQATLALERMAVPLPAAVKPLSSYSGDLIPSESAVLHTVWSHCELMSSAPRYSPGPSLRMLAYSCARLLESAAQRLLDNKPLSKRALDLLVPTLTDGRLEFMNEPCGAALRALSGSAQEAEQLICEHILRTTYPVMVANLQPSTEKIFRHMMKYWEKLLEHAAGRSAYEAVFSSDSENSLGEILLTTPNARPAYSLRIIRLFRKILSGCETSALSSSLCISVCKYLGVAEQQKLHNLLSHLCLAGAAISSPCSSSSDAEVAAVVAIPEIASPCDSELPTPTADVVPTAPLQPGNGSAAASNNSSPAPRTGHSESCSWSGGVSNGSKESVAATSGAGATVRAGAGPGVTAESAPSDGANDYPALLASIVSQLITHCDEGVSERVLSCLVRIGAEAMRGPGAATLLRQMALLADAHSGGGHRKLFPAAVSWLQIIVESLSSLETSEHLEDGSNGNTEQIEAACVLLAYISDALHAVTPPNAHVRRPVSPSWEPPSELAAEIDVHDEQPDDDDTSADDSDEEQSLQGKLCTFTVTAHEFMNQHWYHCHTCKMVDGVGVCTVCARVCHRSHDVTYAKFGNFFCDCGAKSDNSCQALVKRSSSRALASGRLISTSSAPECDAAPPAPTLRRRASSPAPSPALARQPLLAKNIVGLREFLSSFAGWPACLQGVQRLLSFLLPAIRASCERRAAVGCHGRAQRALAQLHLGDKKFTYQDQLMIPTLGSQEGAFENVRMSYTGEQGQTIRQLISAHMIRRVAMCCLASPHGRRQHLAVSHEKGKITVLQLSALLKQADSSKNKLTLIRLSSSPIPFTVLSLAGNPWNEDLLAVCGLKECHVLTFNSGGGVAEHLVLTTVMSAGNYIIRAIWLPGTQTQLALLTADFVKIYDLGKDLVNPVHHFLVPSGKVRDVTFVCQEGVMHMLCMSNVGHIYWQAMTEESRATHGPFYITNTLEVLHNEIKDVAGQVGGGGVSIYYSHTLKMLFFSYVQGKSFFAPLNNVEDTVRGVSMITLSSNSAKENRSGNKGLQSLCQWQEVPGHPGLVTAVMQSSNNPVVIMLKPNLISVQEIKVVPSKAKITDMVTVRHASSSQSGSEQKTTLILLCEDGSLRIYTASSEHTEYWLSSAVQPVWNKKKPVEGAGTTKTLPGKGKTTQSASKGGASGSAAVVQFPVDFFEHCTPMPDVEFGGNDLLQVYNTQQIKHRLNTTGLYVVSTKLSSFAVEINNSDANMVITGIRVLLGSQEGTRAPSYIEVYGRSVPTFVVRSRWYDIPLTREESLQADKKLVVSFGPSQDPEAVCMVDSIKVYGKNKEQFGWPEETEETAACPSTSKVSQEGEAYASGGHRPASASAPALERMACAALEALELGVAMATAPREGALAAARALLVAPCQPQLHARAKQLLHAAHGPQHYHQNKDQAILQHVLDTLSELCGTEDPANMDPEAFFRAAMLARVVAMARPHNLVRYTPASPAEPEDGDWSKLWSTTPGGESAAPQHLVSRLACVLWRLVACRSPWPPGGAAPVVACGLRHADATLHAIVDVTHAYASNADQNMVDFANQIYLSLLLAEDQGISFGAKAAIMRVLRPRQKRRRVYIPDPPPPATPAASTSAVVCLPSTTAAADTMVEGSEHGEENEAHFVDDDNPENEPIVMLAPDGESVEALLDIPPDADDETMVELAIALSLQEGGGAGGMRAAVAAAVAAGGFSDTTASAAGSDDEGSTAATDGSTLRTSPAEVAGSVGSESGGSGAESIGGVSGRSSAYGETVSAPSASAIAVASASVAVPGTSSVPSSSSSSTVVTGLGPATTVLAGSESESRRLHALRLSLLGAALDALPTLRQLPGVRAIPFMQVVLMLTGDLDCSQEADRSVLDRLLESCVAELEMSSKEEGTEQLPVQQRTNRRELQLVIMRLLSVLMARWKSPSTSSSGASSSKSTTSALAADGGSSAGVVARAAAAALLAGGAPAHCYRMLSALLRHWRERGSTGAAAGVVGEGGPPTKVQLLKPQPVQPLPDMQPFFVGQYVKTHALDVFDNYPQLLTEMALRLPCQVHRHCDPAQYFDKRWPSLLCEYMMNQQTPYLRKQVRKLLLLLCGTRERYRQLRDVFALDMHLAAARTLLAGEPAYDALVQLMEHLKACSEMVLVRTGNWQAMCVSHAPRTLPQLLRAACALDEGVAPALLQLLQAALCAPTPPPPPPPPAPNASYAAVVLKADKDKGRTERERSADSDATDTSKFQEHLVPLLVQQIQQQVTEDELRQFIRVFLLETNSTAVRWQAHALILAIYNNCTTSEQSSLLALLWGVWPSLPQYGRKAAQFVDLLGYFSLKTPHVETEKYLASAVDLLRAQNTLLTSHGNAPLYAALSGYVELDGYYLESEPCLVCNNPEVPMATIKLSTVKIDSKFTTTTQMVKLVGSHTIGRISLRIGDLKRSKMVRSINFFYNNRTVQAVQELKNKPGLWHKAKRVLLQSGQTEVRVDFPLPIVACNLMMEYSDFYENQQANGESLQCPRCSASVPANPGVCANCGENVFQCHKCRAINYDEKDPFLCHACGFCKYAKFEYTLTGRPCCAVDSITSDDERKKMVATIGSLLDKADRVYRQLVAIKPQLESLVNKISEQRVETRSGGSDEAVALVGGSQINRVIQTLAHKYCVDSKGHFDDLSKIIQKVLACRRELVNYDRSQNDQLKGENPPSYTSLHGSTDITRRTESTTGCYGCSLAAAEYCLTLLRALASSKVHRDRLCKLGLVQELVHHNLRRGTPQCQEEVRQLICLVTRDNLPATEALCTLLSQRITLSLMGHAATQEHNNAVRPLVGLLGALVRVQDSVQCWEARLRCVVKLWVWCCPQLTDVAGTSPVAAAVALLQADSTLVAISGAGASVPHTAQQHALQQVALPCLRYLQQLMLPVCLPGACASTTHAPNEHKNADQMQPCVMNGANGGAVSTPMWKWCAESAVVDLSGWVRGKVKYADWRRLAAPAAAVAASAHTEDEAATAATAANAPGLVIEKMSVRQMFLAEKYAVKWRRRVLYSHGMRPLSLSEGAWLRPVLFDASSKLARDTACNMLRSLCDCYERTKSVLILLTSFLPEVGKAGEASEQFLQLFQTIASETPWKQFLALRGVLQQIADLMTNEIEQLHRLEETTLTSDLAQGYALKRLTELMALLLEETGARRVYKGRLVGAVLGGYLSLRRLLVQRTRLTDDTQEKLLELLEEMTTGTEAETAEFMAVCIETVQKYPLHDHRTPVFIFERLCSIIYPEENDVGEFFLTLEKDPQQEDFLQGRMLGNPYSSLEAGLGPLMRDVKNKICTDCELVALLEDDNGMELLVCNKIMSLDLPVKDVYKKVWCTGTGTGTGGSEGGDAMRVVYRMRGLLGDATEEFVETLSAANAEAVDDEQTYRMANVLADCGGLEVMISRLSSVSRLGSARALVSTLLRLMWLCVHVRRCVSVLTRGDTRALPVLLRALQLAVEDERRQSRAHLTYQLLEIMERILSVAASESLESFLQFSLTFGGPEYVQALLSCTECPGIRNNPAALGHLTRVLAALVYGNDLKMAMLCEHFKPVLDFDKLDAERWAEDEFRLELFCVLCANIERNTIGGTLKDYLISLGIVRDALSYITKHAPCVKPTLLRTDSDELKEFISRPALKYILRFLTGLATQHEPTQMAVCEKVIPIVHRLEQVSSDEHVGSLAENLLEALHTHPEAAKKVQEVRDYTRQEKKRLAMAMREKQLGALGMRSNERGQVTAQCSLTQQLHELAEEAGLVCCICREGYKYQPTKVLGIYTFTKRCGVEEFEVSARKTLGYTTVSHFNVVHVECHTAAVRLARARDEWESAALQNASTRCNGLLPLWGPHVPESSFASCLARHNTYLQECTGHRDMGHQWTVQDLKLLLLRFARGRTFHDDTGGGGPLSNMQLVPALAHMALYVINTTRGVNRELNTLAAVMEWGVPRVLEAAFEADGPLYHVTLMMLMYPPAKWQKHRLEIFRRMLVVGHARALSPSGPSLRTLTSEQREPQSWDAYKPYVTFAALVQLLYTHLFNVTAPTPEQWPVKLAEYIRHSDEANQKAAERIVSTLTDELLPCASWAEFADAANLLNEMPDPDVFLQEVLNKLP